MIKKILSKNKESKEKIESELHKGFPCAKDCLKETENVINKEQSNYYNEEYNLINKNKDKIIKLIKQNIADGKTSCIVKFKKVTSRFDFENIQKRVIYESIIKEFKEKGFNCSLSTEQRFCLNRDEYDFIGRKSDNFISVNLDWSNGIGDFTDSDIVKKIIDKRLDWIGDGRNHFSFRDYYQKEFKDIYGE